MAIDWGVYVSALPILWEGTIATLEISFCAIILGTLGGLVLGILSLSAWGPARAFVRGYVDFIRGTPLLVQIFLVFFALPVVGISLNETWSGIAALSLNCAGYVSEIVRGTVSGVEEGQSDAAKAIGMTRIQTIVYILVPQAIRPMLPAMTNELISLIKNSSLLSVIAVYELMNAAKGIIATDFVPFQIYTLVAIFYFIMVSLVASLSRYVERRLPAW